MMGTQKIFAYPHATVKCEGCPNRHGGICGSLSEDELEKLNNIARRRRVRQNLPIFRAGDHVTSFVSIVSGVVKLTDTTRAGKHRVITLLYAPAFLGFSYDDLHRFSAMAATEVELCTYPSSSFNRLLLESPAINREVMEHTQRELEFARDWTLMLCCTSSYERVAGFFSVITRRAAGGATATNEQCRNWFLLPLKREEIADYLGLTIETVSRNITRLKHKGLIELKSAREIRVPDLDRLTAEASVEG
ncbi:MAG: Crp/Fnr family transcriptional regulator [Rhodomicrobium sp.]